MIYRSDLRENPNVLYVFGDNLDRQGMGGQAAEMRGEPNAFGIATKRSISHSYPDDYFFDEQPDTKPILCKEFDALEQFILKGASWFNRKPMWKALVIPADGLGTGLSRMPEFAPKALEYIDYRIEQLRYIRTNDRRDNNKIRTGRP